MTAATMQCTLTPVGHRGGFVEELDIRVETSDGQSGTVTLFRFPAGWRFPQYLDWPLKLQRACLRVAREAVPW